MSTYSTSFHSLLDSGRQRVSLFWGEEAWTGSTFSTATPQGLGSPTPFPPLEDMQRCHPDTAPRDETPSIIWWSLGLSTEQLNSLPLYSYQYKELPEEHLVMRSKHMHATVTRDQGPCGPDIHGHHPQSAEWVAVASEYLPSPPVSNLMNNIN